MSAAITAIAVNSSEAMYLPIMNCQRGTGLISRGSSEPRSRSPAVVSIAR